MAFPLNSFGTGLSIDDLPADFRACLADPTGPGCDQTVGSRLSGYGYCSRDPYAQQQFCACVNNVIPCPHVAASACANNPFAYKPSAMRPGGAAFETCKTQPICVNVASVGGQGALVRGLVQQCGPVETIVATGLSMSPAMLGLLFVLFLLVVQIVLKLTTKGAGGVVGGSVAAAWRPQADTY